MKRALIVAFVVAVTAAMKPEFVTETIFRPGFEYVYHYESQVLSGIRTVGNQVSGIKIHAIVNMQFSHNNEVLLRMQRVSVFKVNDVVGRLHDIDLVPDGVLTRLTGEIEQNLVEHLVKPVKFRYEEGEIRGLKTTSGDKFWSVNIKKGLISVLQLKLTGKSMPWSDTESVAESSYAPTYSSSQWGPAKSIRSRLFDTFNPIGSRRMTSSSRLENTYKVMESDVNGECETKYVINTDTSSFRSSGSQMTVTKVKNFESCLNKNTYEQGLFAHLSHYPSENKLIQPAYAAEYVVSGDRHHFLIKRASLNAKYFFKPYGPEGGQLSTQINQKLYLESTSEIRSPIMTESFVNEKHGLKMEIPHASWNPEIAAERYEEHEWSEVVDNKLKSVINAIYPIMDEKATGELFQLQLIVRHVPRRQLVSIIKSYLRPGDAESNKKGEILLDILPTSINPETGKAVIELIRDGTIHGVRAQISITAMALTVKPTSEIVKSLMSMYREVESIERTNPHLRHTILVGVGTLCNKMVNHLRRVNKPIPELTSTIEEMAQELTSLLTEVKTNTDKMWVLMAMGNMGAKELIMPLKSVIADRNVPGFVRLVAVIALRKMAKPFDKLVHPILLSTILDRNEEKLVRIVGAMVLKFSAPTYTTLQLLSSNMRNEPSTQVKTFIYTMLVGLSNVQSPIPEIKQTAKDARKVLKTMRAIPVGIFDSKDITASVFSEDLNMGATWNMQNIKSEHTGLLNGIVHTLHATVFGSRIKLIKAGVDGEMITALLRRLIGPYGLLKDIFAKKATVADLLKPLVKPEFTTRWSDFIGKKSFTPYTEGDVSGSVFGGVLGYDLFLRKFGAEAVESWTNFAMTSSPKFINNLKEGITFKTLKTLSLSCNSLVLPTPAGIPLSLNLSTNAIVKLEGYVKATSLPSIFDFMRRRPFMSKKIEVEANLKPSIATEVFGYMGVDMKWIRTGVALRGHAMVKLPFKGQLAVDPSDSKMILKIEPPTESVKTFTAKVEPLTFVYYVPKNIHNLPFKFELKTIKSPDTVANMKYEKDYGCQLTGLEWHMKALWTKCVHSWCPYYPLTGKHEISVSFKNPDTTPKELVLKIKKFSQDWFNEYENDQFESTTDAFARNYRTMSRYSTDERFEEDPFSRMFDSVEVDRLFSAPRKVEVLAELNINGYRSSKVLNSKLTWISEKNYLEHQFNVQVVAAPCADMDEFKLKINSMWKCSQLFAFESQPKYDTKDAIGKIDIYWGRSRFNEAEINCKIWELDEATWSEELHSEGVEHSHYLDTVGFRPKIYRYGFEAVYPKITPVDQMYFTKIHDLIKYGLYNYLKIGLPANIPQNKVLIYGQYLTHIEKLSVVIKTPRETDLLLDMPLHCPLWKLYRPCLHDINPSNVYRNFSDNMNIEHIDEPTYDSYLSYKDYTPSLHGVCKIYGDKLVTFDGTPILLPIHERESRVGQCEVLLARDCSERGTFAVTGSFMYGKWAVKIITPSHNIELIPDESERSSHIRVKVNNDEAIARYGNPLVLYEEPEDPSSPVIEKVDEAVKVYHRELGVTVMLMENNKISIKVSPVSILQGRLCGLCGNHNYDIGDDMTSMEGTKFTDSRLFVMDNIYSSDRCDTTDYRKQLNYRHSGYCKMKKTMVIAKTEDNEDVTCFSKNAVTMCRSHCNPESMSSRNVRFVCMSTNDDVTDRLINKYESGYTDLTEELRDFNAEFEDVVEIPDNCVTDV